MSRQQNPAGQSCRHDNGNRTRDQHPSDGALPRPVDRHPAVDGPQASEPDVARGRAGRPAGPARLRARLRRPPPPGRRAEPVAGFPAPGVTATAASCGDVAAQASLSAASPAALSMSSATVSRRPGTAARSTGKLLLSRGFCWIFRPNGRVCLSPRPPAARPAADRDGALPGRQDDHDRGPRGGPLPRRGVREALVQVLPEKEEHPPRVHRVTGPRIIVAMG